MEFKRIVVAGAELAAKIEAEKIARVPKRGPYFESEALCAFQREVANRGVIEAELVESMYGWSVRYASGIQNFGLIYSSRRGDVDGSYENAVSKAKAWASEAPARRIVSVVKKSGVVL